MVRPHVVAAFLLIAAAPYALSTGPKAAARAAGLTGGSMRAAQEEDPCSYATYLAAKQEAQQHQLRVIQALPRRAAASLNLNAFGLGGVWNLKDYGETKTRFMQLALCRLRPPPRVICELGHYFGGTAILFKHAVPSAKIEVFDLGITTGGAEGLVANASGTILSQAEPGRFSIHFGYSTATIPEWHRRHPRQHCGATYFDSANDRGIVAQDLAAVQSAAPAGALLILNHVCSLSCTQGAVGEAARREMFNRWMPCETCRQRWGGTPMAWVDSHEAGRIRVTECAFPTSPTFTPTGRKPDGLCIAWVKKP
jgi:hypothetical protein